VRVGSLFSGIGGFDLGFERAGMQIAWQVEIDSFCQSVLAKHWPNVSKYRDIKEIKEGELQKVDLICGGFPCQPFSVAGKQRGKEDDRYLWPEMLRIIQDVRPRWVVGENVPNITRLALDNVISDLERENYTCQTFRLAACSLKGSHKRERIWIVAYSNSSGLQGYGGLQEHPNQFHTEQRGSTINRERQFEPCLGGNVDGVSSWLDKYPSVALKGEKQYTYEPPRIAHNIPERINRLKALGNSVYVPLVELIGRSIMLVERR
jgi:DNA (cytosine-5)-methyltransferase 1